MSDKKSIQIDQKAPSLQGVIDDGSTLTLDSLLGRWIVIYFYPKDSTPGCTTQAQGFRDLYEEFSQQGCEIIGVSRDSVASHARFRAKQALPFHLVSDADKTWCKAFDVIHEKVLYGKRYLGIVRSTFLINQDGVIRAQWRGVKVPGHAAAVLEHLARA